MSRLGQAILSGLLSCFVGTTYFLIEVVWKMVRGRSDNISWTMLVLALLIGLLIERLGAEQPWETPIWVQAIFCGLTITVAELAAGCILNLWLGWNVWDYTNMPGNLLGQVCPQFMLLWCVVSGPAIVLLDWMRYAIAGGEKPRYFWK